jgi:hypothetical protein
VPAGPTASQRSQIVERINDEAWNQLFPADSGVQKPHVDVVTTVAPAALPAAIVDCLGQSGIGATLTPDGNIAITRPDAWPHVADYAKYICTMQYPVDASSAGFLSDAQVGYLYDYFADRLVPCLRLLGYDVGFAPDRQYFVDHYYAGAHWTPYRYAKPAITDADWSHVDYRCPPPPVDPFGSFH